MKIVLMLAHSVAEYDDVRMLTGLGHDVSSIGAYIDPAHPGDDLRPALPGAAAHPDLAALCGDQMAAKEHLPDGVIDWADAFIVHHYLRQWVVPQWPRIKHKRVIWRTCGQSDVPLEEAMAPLRRQGLQIVRYSPKEKEFFEGVGRFAGQDALIRFGKYPEDWHSWTGEALVVGNITQNMVGRGEWVGKSWWLRATKGLPVALVGDRSEEMPGGLGKLSYDDMRSYLRRIRAYAYTGTMPAPYTLGLIEALMTGTPVVSIGGESWMGPEGLWEGDQLAVIRANDPERANGILARMLEEPAYAQWVSEVQREEAILEFGIDTVGPQWAEFLDG